MIWLVVLLVAWGAYLVYLLHFRRQWNRDFRHDKAVLKDAPERYEELKRL